jgi:hypothetical protein
MYRVTPRLQVGLEGNIAAEEVGPLLNWIAVPETEEMPLVTFGTSSDRIFSPEGEHAYYMTVAKGLHGTNLSPYVGVSWSTWEDRLLFPAGLNVALAPEWDFLQMYDGRNSHSLLTYKTEAVNYSVMLIKMKHIGFSVGIGF